MRRGSMSRHDECPICTRLVALLDDGTVRVHGWKADKAGNCAGSYKRPVNAPPDLPEPAPGGNWTDHAACTGRDPELFFLSDTRAAKRICGTCVVAALCLEWALSIDAEGVWGGFDERERRSLARRRASA